MAKGNKRYQDDSLTERFDLDGILFVQGCEIFGLVDFLVHEVDRLCTLVVEAREQANALAAEGGRKMIDLPYLMATEDVFDGSYDDHPAMLRYEELYGRRRI